MGKQVGLPTFFMALGCADLQWDELTSIIGKLKGEKLTSERISSMDYFERCSYLKVKSCKLPKNKYVITSTQITNTEIFAFIAVLAFKYAEP